MKFEELSKEHQEFLIDCLFEHIKRKVKKEERDQVMNQSVPGTDMILPK